MYKGLSINDTRKISVILDPSPLSTIGTAFHCTKLTQPLKLYFLFGRSHPTALSPEVIYGWSLRAWIGSVMPTIAEGKGSRGHFRTVEVMLKRNDEIAKRAFSAVELPKGE